jgi:hypothetical protein
VAALATRQRVAAEPETGSAEPPAARLFESQGPTLEDSILATWSQLGGEGRAECPVCGGSMPAPGGCEACGTELS